jgi:hypothetical protein
VADTDAVLTGFVTTCQIYPERCALASYAGGKTQNLLYTLKQLLDDLKTRPLALGSDILTEYADYGTTKSLIFQALYNPPVWPLLATFLRALLEQDGATAASVGPSIMGPSATPPFPADTPIDPTHAIRCSDNAFRSDNLTDVLPLVHEFYQQGWFAGDVLTVPQPLTCPQWRVRAKEVYSGGFQNITTRKPILFVSNAYDPVSPLISARNASAAFPGSEVLVQNGYGVS